MQTCSEWQNMYLPLCIFSTEAKQGKALPCFSFYTIKLCPFHCLVSTFSTSSPIFLCFFFFLVALLFKICSNMDWPGDKHTKWSKWDRERQISYKIAYMQSLKTMIQINLFKKQKHTHWLREGAHGNQG